MQPLSLRVLVVDPDVDVGDALGEALEELGCSVTRARSGPEGLRLARAGGLDCVLLELVLPGLDGFDVLARLRTESQVPVLLVTTRRALTDKVRGLDGGADDYLEKPFELEELVARIRAVVRRKRP